jgi:transcriptional regulator with XRE-family HTH domain
METEIEGGAGTASGQRRREMQAGKELKKLRQQLGLSIREVVRASNGMLDKTTVSRIEHGDRGLSIKAVYCFSNIYGIGMETIAELVLKKKALSPKTAFDASPGERNLLKKFRNLTPGRRRLVAEITDAFALVGDYKNVEEGRKHLLRELKRVREDSD